jgi:chemotaxis protein CheZ
MSSATTNPESIKTFVENSLRARAPDLSEVSIKRTADAVVTLVSKEIEFSERLENLAAFINQSRIEIAALKPEQVSQEFLPKATDELDAVVHATRDATNRIMDSADVIMQIAGNLNGDDQQDLMNAVNTIYESCSFQDITGQRIAKVVTTLKVIEQRIDRMMATLNGETPSAEFKDQLPQGWVTGGAGQADIDSMFGEGSKDSNLQGPQTPGKGISQADIDKLFD